jgi:hypothetical protein
MGEEQIFQALMEQAEDYITKDEREVSFLRVSFVA